MIVEGVDVTRDVERIIRVCKAIGRHDITGEEARNAWRAYSDDLSAVWMRLPETDEVLLTTVREYLTVHQESKMSDSKERMVPVPMKLVVGPDNETFEVYLESINLEEKHNASIFDLRVICVHKPGDTIGVRMAKAILDARTGEREHDYRGSLPKHGHEHE